jgi:hypothetical protein
MDYLTNFYKNKAQVLSEQIHILEAKLARLHEDAPASTFSGSGKGQQTFSDQQLRDQMKQHKRTGLFGAEISRDKQSQEYRDAEDELSRRSSAGKPAQQQSGNQQRTQAPVSQPKPQQAAPVQTPKAQPSQPSQPKFDASQVYTGDDSWLSNATAPAKLPSSFAGDRGSSGTPAKSSDPMRHYGEPGVLPPREEPKFDVLSATKGLLDQMYKKSDDKGSAPSSASSGAERKPVQATKDPLVSTFKATGFIDKPTVNPGVGKVQLDPSDMTDERRKEWAKKQLEMEVGATPTKKPPVEQPRVPGFWETIGDNLSYAKDIVTNIPAGVSERIGDLADGEWGVNDPADKGEQNQISYKSSMMPKSDKPAAPEKPGLFGELGNAFANAGRALFGMPQEVSKSIGRRVY